MNNLLTIYKFHFPFLDLKYELTKNLAIISDLKSFFLYEELDPKIEERINGKNTFITLSFKGGKIEIYHGDYLEFFVPIFQLELFLQDDIELQKKVFNRLYSLTIELGRDDYIYDVDESFLYYRRDDAISIVEDLMPNFQKTTQRQIEKFIKKVEDRKENLEEYLSSNKYAKYYFLYLIFLCYIFYINTTKLIDNKAELESMLGSINSDVYKLQIEFGKTRVEYVENINIVQFRNFLDLLKIFFNIFM